MAPVDWIVYDAETDAKLCRVRAASEEAAIAVHRSTATDNRAFYVRPAAP